jgi:hypothetical protein
MYHRGRHASSRSTLLLEALTALSTVYSLTEVLDVLCPITFDKIDKIQYASPE